MNGSYSLWRRPNAWNVSSRNSLRWPIYIIDSGDKTKWTPIDSASLSSFESYRIYSIKRRGVYYIFCDSSAALFRWRRLIKIQFVPCKQLYGNSAFNRINTIPHLCIWGWGYSKTWKGVAKNEPTYAVLYQRITLLNIRDIALYFILFHRFGEWDSFCWKFVGNILWHQRASLAFV